MFVFYKFHCCFRANASDFFHNEETLQSVEYGKEELKEVETLWTVEASYTHITQRGSLTQCSHTQLELGQFD